MSLENEIGARICELRNKNGETQQQLANALTPQVKRETINQWENGSRQLKAEALISLAKHFNVSTDYLLGITDVMSTDIKMQEVCDFIGLSDSAVLNIKNISDEICSREQKASPRYVLSKFLEHEHLEVLMYIISKMFNLGSLANSSYFSEDFEKIYNEMFTLEEILEEHYKQKFLISYGSDAVDVITEEAVSFFKTIIRDIKSGHYSSTNNYSGKKLIVPQFLLKDAQLMLQQLLDNVISKNTETPPEE